MTDKIIHIDHTNLNKYLKNTAPYIFVDTADIIPGKSGKGKKFFANNEWFFKCHFPNNPIVPGVFQLETIMQTAALAIYTTGVDEPIYAQKCKNLTFYHPVYPGQILYSNIEIDYFKRGIIKVKGDSYLNIDNKKIVTCEANFQIIVPSTLNILSPKMEN